MSNELSYAPLSQSPDETIVEAVNEMSSAGFLIMTSKFYSSDSLECTKGIPINRFVSYHISASPFRLSHETLYMVGIIPQSRNDRKGLLYFMYDKCLDAKSHLLHVEHTNHSHLVLQKENGNRFCFELNNLLGERCSSKLPAYIIERINSGTVFKLSKEIRRKNLIDQGYYLEHE